MRCLGNSNLADDYVFDLTHWYKSPRSSKEFLEAPLHAEVAYDGQALYTKK